MTADRHRDIHELLALNDTILAPLIRAESDAGRDAAIGTLIVGRARPLAGRVVGRQGTSEGFGATDGEDVLSVVSLRLVVKLRSVAESAEEAIDDFDKYVVALTYNAIADALRRRFPERARLKTRLRYVLTHDPRLGLWQAAGGPVCGLAEWRDEEPKNAAIERSRVTRRMLDRERPGDALADLFRLAGGPMSLAALVDFLADLWQVTDLPAAGIDTALEVQGGGAGAALIETRDLLRGLWREIRLLRPMQRRALLLNLRDAEMVNVAALLVVGGIASFDDLASAIEMTAQELAGIWNDLPLDDLRIAGMLGITRQQVINLRKSARERLSRRMR